MTGPGALPEPVAWALHQPDGRLYGKITLTRTGIPWGMTDDGWTERALFTRDQVEQARDKAYAAAERDVAVLLVEHLEACGLGLTAQRIVRRIDSGEHR